MLCKCSILKNVLFVSLTITYTGFIFANCYKVNIGECVVYYQEPCKYDDINFYLYYKHGNRLNIIRVNAFRPLIPIEFNRNLPLKILVHGYGGLPMDYAIKNITEGYMKINYNVIVVDWSPISAIPCYPAAFFNTWHVGQCIGVLSVSLAKIGILPNNTHILGFSLGAHVASFASNHLQKTLGMPYNRITGLDPALPLFATLHNEWKLDPSDAPFVDVLHTSAGSFGKLEALGHVDFYINGGVLQPDCVNSPYPPLCSHAIVGLYYASTISNGKYYGISCQSLVHYNLKLCNGGHSKSLLLGEHVDRTARGVYFVDVPSILNIQGNSSNNNLKLIYNYFL